MFRSLSRRLVPALLVIAPMGDDDVTLPPDDSEDYSESIAAWDPEHEFNCDIVLFPRADLRLIIPVELSADEERSATLRRLGKLTADAILDAGGPLATLVDAGVVHGLEVDWFFPTGGAAPTGYRLPLDTDLVAPDATLLARVFAFDEPQFITRRASVEAQVGHVMDVYPVWLDAPLSSVSPQGSLSVLGHGNAFFGDVQASQDALVFGRHAFHGELLHVGNLATGMTGGGLPARPALTLETPQPMQLLDAARSSAQQSGLYASGNLVLTNANLPAPGTLVFAEGRIDVRTQGARLHTTLISATGSVRFLGSSNTVLPVLGETVAVSFGRNVVLNGAANTLAGELHAPQGHLMLSGRRNVVIGAHTGARVTVNGVGNVISDGTHPTSPH